MRILHTADWHLGVRTGGQDRLPDQIERLAEVMSYCGEHQADVLLVCGDVLEDPRPQRLSATLSQLAELLGPELERGMQCVFVAGNHDSAYTFDLLAGVQRLLGPQAQGQVHFVKEPTLLELTAGGQQAAVLVALPYPTPSAYPLDALGDLEAKQAGLRQAVSDHLGSLLEEADEVMPDLPKVLAGHFLLRDAPAHTGTREISESEDVRVDSDRLDEFAYIALGHVHKPNSPRAGARYCGALDRIDFGEAEEERQALLVEVGHPGEEARITELPLNATPMARFEIGAADEIAQAAETLPEPERTLVKLTLRVTSTDSASLWVSEARRCFRRLFQPLDIRPLDEPLPSLVTGDLEQLDTAQTVRNYLEDELDPEDPDREELLALSDQLLAEGDATE